MSENTEKLRREIEELERQIAAHPFGGLFDKKRADQLYHRLKKKRKELARAESTGLESAAVAVPPAAPKMPTSIAEEAPRVTRKTKVRTDSKPTTRTPASARKSGKPSAAKKPAATAKTKPKSSGRTKATKKTLATKTTKKKPK